MEKPEDGFAHQRYGIQNSFPSPKIKEAASILKRLLSWVINRFTKTGNV
jgi:hypothetical protein